MRHLSALLALLLLPSATLHAQDPHPLTLAQAESIAIANQPRILAARLRAQSAAQRMREAHAGLLPTIAFNATGAIVADTSTATAAGALTTSSLSDRFAYGANLSQLITDFGRTSALISVQRSLTAAQQDRATLTAAEVRLDLRTAYFQVMGAEAVLRAARQALTNRQLISHQIEALAHSQLRSTLDLSFAGVLESEAELAVLQAESAVQQNRAHLATTMGLAQPLTAPLVEPPLPDALPPDASLFLTNAISQRADLSEANALQQAASHLAAADRRLSYPTLNALGAAGSIPYRDHTLHDSYAAAGFNLNIPVFNGGLFAARRAETDLEAKARARDTQQLKLSVGEQVQDQWIRANEAFRSLAVSSRLVDQSQQALRLAQARYDAGLGSIVELNQAQLSETSAEITAAAATDDYQTRRAELDFAAGLLN